MYAVSLKILINILDAIARVLLENIVAHLANAPVSAILMNVITLWVQAAGRVLTAVGIIVIPDMSSTIWMPLVKVLDHGVPLRKREGRSFNRQSTA